MAKSLFISYDGLTDTLGQSQILPYMTGLSKIGHQVTILSCEKRDKYNELKDHIEAICKKNNIRWVPIFFHSKPRIIAKYYDLYNLEAMAVKLYKKEKFDIIHSRSYLPGLIGRRLKKKFGVRFLFDMRSFWVDERVDGGLWNVQKQLYKYAYRRWKGKESQMIADADHIVSLTESAKLEMKRWQSYRNTPISVIPCSADLSLFSPVTNTERNTARKMLEIGNDVFVVSYLGSLGTWYLIDEMFMFFGVLKEYLPESRFVFITPSDPAIIEEKILEFGLSKSDFVIRFAQRRSVPVLMKASDISLSFIKPSYSKIASSPTKLGEVLAMNIPAICNDIGDVGNILQNTNGGYLIDEFSNSAFRKAAVYCLDLHTAGQPGINRPAVINYYDLENALNSYASIYESLVEIQ
ncbi:glycosyltransferase [Niabella hirudinis]|uniref:glycosyltransferase n=1 Tax=Niabella hirudinis TaxID=1285929 RepID=UPI003EBBACBB